MRILFLIDRLYSPGGAERQLVTLARALTVRGHECTIAALFPGSNLASEMPRWGIAFEELGVRHQRNFLGAAVKVARLIRRGNFDAVQAHLLSSCIASGLSRILTAGPPRVAVLHNLDYAIHPPKNLRQKALRSLHRFALSRLTDGVVAVSDSVAQHYRSEMGIEQISTIPNSIELEEPAETFLAGREELRSELGAGAGKDLLAYSARMVKQKGHLVLLRSLEILRSRDVTPKVLLIGSGPLESAIREAVRRAELENQVTMTGNLPYAEALRHIAAADLFVSPSGQEGFGLAIAEAMALGVPVVAVAVGAVPEVVEDGVTGLLVPPNGAESLANAIERAMADGELRQKFQKAAPERVRNNFTPSAVAGRWESYLNEAIAGRGPRIKKQERMTVSARVQSNG